MMETDTFVYDRDPDGVNDRIMDSIMQKEDEGWAVRLIFNLTASETMVVYERKIPKPTGWQDA